MTEQELANIRKKAIGNDPRLAQLQKLGDESRLNSDSNEKSNMGLTRARLVRASLMIMAACTSVANAQETSEPSAEAEASNAMTLSIELNALQDVDRGCRASFLVKNDLGTPTEELGLELAVFGAGGGLERLVLLRFGALPEAKSRVRQFDLEDLRCGDVSRVLVNDVVSCSGGALTPASCLAATRSANGTDVPFGL